MEETDIMKKLIISMLALFAVMACTPDLHFLPDSFQSQTAEISGDEEEVSVVFLSKAGTATLLFKSNKQWTASFLNGRAKEWCSIPSESGGKGTYTLTIAVKENETYDERAAVIALQCEDIKRTIVVTQKQKDALLLSPGRVELPQTGGDFSIEVRTNVDFTLSIPSDASQWLHRAETKGLDYNKITILADPNAEIKPRQAIIVVSSSIGNEEVNVYQVGEEPALVISARNVEVPTVGGDFEVQITSNMDVETEILPATCDWVEEVKTKVLSTNTYYYVVAPNETGEARKMSLVFRNSEYKISDTLHVFQPYLPGFSITTARQEIVIPLLMGEPGEETWIFWGDGSFEPYSPNLSHSYVTPGLHTVLVEGDPLVPIRISDYEDGMVIDFSRLNKKEEAQ